VRSNEKELLHTISGSWPLGTALGRLPLVGTSESEPSSKRGGLRTPAEPEFFQDIAYVVPCRSFGDHQVLGDLAIGISLRKPLKHLAFPRREFGELAWR
jgi:hypothetical protein